MPDTATNTDPGRKNLVSGIAMNFGNCIGIIEILILVSEFDWYNISIGIYFWYQLSITGIGISFCINLPENIWYPYHLRRMNRYMVSVLVSAIFFYSKHHKTFQGTLGTQEPTSIRVKVQPWSINGPYRAL